MLLKSASLRLAARQITPKTRGLATVAAPHQSSRRWAGAAAGVSAGLGYAYYSISSDRVSNQSPRTLLGDDEWVDIKVADVIELNHNVSD
jgi:hypothetical protein